MRLHLEVIDAPRDYNFEMSIGKLTPSDLTEAALRTALFGDPNPLADQHMGFSDPLSPLRNVRISDEIVRPLAELLVVDVLVGSDRAALVTEFKLRVAIRGVPAAGFVLGTAAASLERPHHAQNHQRRGSRLEHRHSILVS